MGVLRVTPRGAVILGLLFIFLGLAVAAVGVHLMAGLPAGLVADGAAAALVGLAVVALWA